MTRSKSGRVAVNGSYAAPGNHGRGVQRSQQERPMETTPIHVLVADNHPLVRRGLTYLINARPDLKLAGLALSGAEAVRGVHQFQPDLILFDLGLGCDDALTAIAKIGTQTPTVPVLAITGFTDDEQIYRALKAGAAGHLLRDTSPAALLEAIHQAHRGESSLHPSMARRILAELRTQPPFPPTDEPLTLKENTILRLLARGFSVQKIAGGQEISETTVRRHIRSVLDKLQLATRERRALYVL